MITLAIEKEGNKYNKYAVFNAASGKWAKQLYAPGKIVHTWGRIYHYHGINERQAVVECRGRNNRQW